MLPIATVENAVLERLRAAMPYLSEVGPYGGELEGKLPPLPAVWVDFQGATASRAVDTAGRSWRTELEFYTIVAAAAPFDTDGQVGSYRLLDGVMRTLIACDLGLQGVGRMKPGVLAPAKAVGASAYAQRWSVVCEYALAEEEAPLHAVSLAYWLRPATESGPAVAGDMVTFPA